MLTVRHECCLLHCCRERGTRKCCKACCSFRQQQRAVLFCVCGMLKYGPVIPAPARDLGPCVAQRKPSAQPSHQQAGSSKHQSMNNFGPVRAHTARATSCQVGDCERDRISVDHARSKVEGDLSWCCYEIWSCNRRPRTRQDLVCLDYSCTHCVHDTL